MDTDAKLRAIAERYAEIGALAPHLELRGRPIGADEIAAFEAREGAALPDGFTAFLRAFGDAAYVPAVVGGHALPIASHRTDPVWSTFEGPLTAAFPHAGDARTLIRERAAREGYAGSMRTQRRTVRRSAIAVALACAVAGCSEPGGDPLWGPETLWDHFPFGGQRTWTWAPADSTDGRRRVGELEAGGPKAACGSPACNVYRVAVRDDCAAGAPECTPAGWLRTIAMSSDEAHGVLIHGYEDADVDVAFDPPVALAPTWFRVGDNARTVSGGSVWVSTLVRFDPCPVQLEGPDFDRANCAVHLRLQGAGEPAAAVAGLSGEIWAAIGLNVVAYTLDTEGIQWQLSARTCEPDEACTSGDW